MNTLNIELTKEQRTAIVDWIVECDCMLYEQDEIEAREGVWDKGLVRYIEKNYEGGVTAFVESM